VDTVAARTNREAAQRIAALERELTQLRAGCRNLTQFSFSDEGAKCKVYVEVGADLERREVLESGPAYAEAGATVSFAVKSCKVNVLIPSTSSGGVAERRAVAFQFESEIVPEKCSYKVDRAKGRITLTLKKEDEERKWKRGPTTQAI